jgi:hypothetical protein
MILSSQAPEVKRTRSKQPVRTLRIEEDPFGGGFVRITVNDKPTVYRTKLIPLDPAFGAAFGFTYQKVDEDHNPLGERYDLCVSSHDPITATISCECIGHLRWGRCKHEAALRVLMTKRK